MTYNGTIFCLRWSQKPFCSPSRRGVPITVAHSLTCNISPPLLLILSGFCDVKMPIIHINYTCFIIRESDYDLAKRIQMDVSGINDNLKAITNTKKTELLFVALFLRMLKKGGKCACIVPDGVLFDSSKAHKAIRQELVENHQLRAVISMPSGVFKPYAGVSTAVLVFTKTGAGGTEEVWFYDMKADGFSLDDKRSEVKENDIPDIINRFKNLEAEHDRKRTDQSFFVPKKDIVENGYDLSINKYKEVEYKAVEYPPTSEIVAEIEALEEQIQKEFAELKTLLGL